MLGCQSKNRKVINRVYFVYLIFIPLMFISDGVTKYFSFVGEDFTRFSLLVRMIFELIIVGYLLQNLRKQNWNVFLSIGILFLGILVGNLSLKNYDFLSEIFVSFNKYIFLFVTYLFFSSFLDFNKNYFDKVYKLLTIILSLNIIVIFLGFVFEIDYFKSFPKADYRYGYNGVYFAGNESSFVLMIMVSFFYFRAYYEQKSKIILILSILATMLSGMKAVYGFLILLGLYHLVIKTNKRIFILSSPFIVYAVYLISSYLQSEEFQILISYFLHTLDDKGLLWMLLSGRQEFIDLKLIPLINDWTLLNFLFGGQNITYLMEMDFFDVLLFFGAIGSIVYFYIFYKLFIKKLLWHEFFTFFTFSILLLAFFGGHFLNSATSAIYFSLVIIYFQKYRLEHNEKNLIN
jgi:hypothetical protein